MKRVLLTITGWTSFVFLLSLLCVVGCRHENVSPPVSIREEAPAVPLNPTTEAPVHSLKPPPSTGTQVTVDSDGDGINDAEERRDGTDPNNDRSVSWKVLSSFRFDRADLSSESGQLPVTNFNVIPVPAFEGQGIRVSGPGPVSLQYRIRSEDGRPVISLKRGSLHLKIKPFWQSNDPRLDFEVSTAGGYGPGAWVTLFETPAFAVRIDPFGTNLVLVSRDGSGNVVTNLQGPIAVRTINTRPEKKRPGETYWCDCLVNWAPEGTSFFWMHPDMLMKDKDRFRATGRGLNVSVQSGRGEVMSFGSALDGSGAVNAVLDSIDIGNVPAVLATNSWILSAVGELDPPGIRVLWSGVTNPLVQILRREWGTAGWRPLAVALGTSYFDAAAIPGRRYEYNLNTGVANSDGNSPDRIGQTITASVLGSAIESRGKLVLLVDQTLGRALEPDLSTLMTNLVGDGWEAIRFDAPRHVDDYAGAGSFRTNAWNISNVIKPFILSQWDRYGSSLKQILIVGHVAIPYTGDRPDDGHSSPSAAYGSHQGAWASDLYYGDVDGVWSDRRTSTNAHEFEPRNFPGDGKFDDDFIPANRSGVAALEIAVSRIDFARLPTFRAGEASLLKSYLRKNSRYRMGTLTFAPGAMETEFFYQPISARLAAQTASEISSKFGVLAPAVSGDVFNSSGSRLLGVQSGPGYIDRINDARPQQHAAADFASGRTDPACAFYLLRGSFFGDWNLNNNLLRSILTGNNGGLAAGWLLWSGSWRLDPAAVGLTINDGYLSVINERMQGEFPQSARATEWMGDGTLRYPVLPPPEDLSLRSSGGALRLTWSGDDRSSIHVYRSTQGITGTFQRLTPEPIRGRSFVDTAPPAGAVLYMVRALQLTTTGAGTFTNISQGVFVGK